MVWLLVFIFGMLIEMIISEVIAQLEELKQEHGDIECYKEYDGIAVDIENVSFSERSISFSSPENKTSGIIID